MRDYVKLTDRDNVAVVTHDTGKDTEIMPGLVLLMTFRRHTNSHSRTFPKTAKSFVTV